MLQSLRILLLGSLAPGLALAGPQERAPAPDAVTDTAQLAELARAIEPQVAALRGLEFKRPVAVELSTRETLQDYALRRMDEMQPREVRLAYEEMLELLGLIPADMDLEATLIELLQSQVAGFYDPADDKFYLVAGLGESFARATMAHELVHALDDQHVDLDAQMKGLIGDGDAAAAFHAVMEGGATEIQNQWMFGNLSRTEMMRMATEAGAMGEGLTDGPEILWRPLLHSYVQGGAFLKRSGGAIAAAMKQVEEADLMRAFAEPPLSTEQVLHPSKYWDADKLDRPTRVRQLPKEGSGWRVLHSDTMGELGLAILVDPKRGDRVGMNPMTAMMQPFANKGADGWDGDRMTLFAKGDARYLRFDSVWDDADEAAEFAEALGSKSASFEAALAAVEVNTRPEGTEARSLGQTMQVGGVASVSLELWIGERPMPEELFDLEVVAPEGELSEAPLLKLEELGYIED